jgi:hypothetical protein
MVNPVLYVIGMVALKYSILLLYRRLFPGKRFRNGLIIIASFVLAWGIAGATSCVVSCWPIEKAWDPSLDGRCIDFGSMALAIGIINIVLDFVILGYPLPTLWKLKISTRHKILLSFTVVVGCW